MTIEVQQESRHSLVAGRAGSSVLVAVMHQMLHQELQEVQGIPIPPTRKHRKLLPQSQSRPIAFRSCYHQQGSAGHPNPNPAQLHSEAQEAATTEGCRNCSKRRKELQEVQEELRQVQDDLQEVQHEGRKLQQDLQEVQEVHQMLKSQIQAFSNASTMSRKNGIKKSRCHKKFKLGKFVSREFKWDSARQHRPFSRIQHRCCAS